MKKEYRAASSDQLKSIEQAAKDQGWTFDCRTDIDKEGYYRWIIQLEKDGIAIVANEWCLDEAIREMKKLMKIWD